MTHVNIAYATYHVIWLKSIACIMCALKHFTVDWILCDELAGLYLIACIDDTFAPIVNILVIYVIKVNIWIHNAMKRLK